MDVYPLTTTITNALEFPSSDDEDVIINDVMWPSSCGRRHSDEALVYKRFWFV